ncbi:MAG: Ca-activated chloride channel family protein [Myxococcota bacterium]|jgi:Ca-activated chloride channel family protein
MALRFLRRHKTAISWILVATTFTALALLLLQKMPWLDAQLAAWGYQLEEPQYLYLAGGIPLLWLIRLHSLTDMPWIQQLLSVTLRSAMLLALALALSKPVHISHESEKVATVMMVDVSESVPDAVIQHAQTQLNALVKASGDDHIVRLVTFAETARLVPLARDADGKLPGIERHKKGGLGTDLQRAMRLAYSLFPPGRHKRLIVVSDGNETNGNGLAEVETAVRLGIRVSHYGLPEFDLQPETMVVGLDVPETIEPNVPFEVSAQVMANSPQAVRCTLKLDKIVAGIQKLEAKAGEQTVEFEKVRVREGGDHDFVVDCVPDLAEDATPEERAKRDRFASNNTFAAKRFVKEKKKLLYLEGESMYSRNFRDALKDDFEVEVKGSGAVPRTLAAAKEYKAIVVSDVPRLGGYGREHMSNRQMKVLHNYAKQGGLLLFTGGQDSLGPGGYGGTYLERRVLPVKLDVEHELETPRLAMVMVIDKSGSMSGKKIELAKKAARMTVMELDKRDRVGIVAFDSGPQKLIKMTRAGSKSRFDRALRRLTAGGGTAIGPALEDAFEMLDGVEAKVKHVILMTDGQSNRTGILHMVEEAAARKITVSTIAVGAGSDRTLLKSIADVGNGRWYHTESAEALPKLFVDETREVAGESVVEDAVKPILSRKYAGLRFLRGSGLKGAPPLAGYVPTRARSKSQVVMRTSTGDPLLVRWKRGKGWVYVWTSDIKNKWARRWLRWSGFAGFWRQLIKDGIHEEKREEEFPIEVEVARHTLRIATDAVDKDDQFIGGVTARALITDPDGETQEVVLTQSAAGRYEAEVKATKYGPWSVDVTHTKDGNKLAVSRGRAAYPYPEEHLKFEPDLSRVETLTANTGGLVDPTPAALLKVNAEPLTHKSPVWHWLVYAVLAAFLVDVLLRRIRFWPASTLAWSATRDR